jgi:2-C-methyl-D-erythritol 2,4-cyclodiphosphate synthase
MRVGIGYDVHRLIEGRKLILGGVEIPYLKGLDGYSDADVLIHALCDALLGAVGTGDIGELFPNNDPTYQGISSLKLLLEVASLISKKGYSILNVDATIVAQEPRLSPFKEKMRESIAKVLNIEEGDVNIKATTPKGLGDLGRGEAIAAYAVVSINK